MASARRKAENPGPLLLVDRPLAISYRIDFIGNRILRRFGSFGRCRVERLVVFRQSFHPFDERMPAIRQHQPELINF